MAPLLVLEGEKLQKLARLVRNQEIESVHNIVFKSEEDLAKYERDVSENYNKAIKLLDDADAMMVDFQNDETRSSIAHDVYSYVQKAVNSSLQAVRNYTLRKSYLEKISDHSKELFEALANLDPTDIPEVGRLAEEAAQYNKALEEFLAKHQSKASINFSQLLKQEGTTFEELVNRYKNKRGLPGLFEDLEDEEKLAVYNDIIEASGRGRVIEIKEIATTAAGVAVLILAAGVMIWDIFTSAHPLETATRDAMMNVASIGGALVGEVVEAALPSLLGIEASSLFVMATAIVTSFVGAFVIGEFVGWLIDIIFSSGGTYPHSTDGHICYVAPLPDGEALARQISHQ
ncbi:uncharacterized protein LOC111023876 [Momordica charantia]|uniref:Uncharacterized protein LOC111023876 n=1 Tax=Momordica charantia TaxID=3673 RepID=A0A6J1DWV3_MOMCH|nr:uncharacterized protein LOC111023876 [Momordica charantia]